MPAQPLSQHIKRRIREAAHTLGAADPVPYVGPLLDRTFYRAEGDQGYADNTLTPGTVAFEPSFSEREPDALRFTIEPLGPGELPAARRDEATREMRRLVERYFGRGALHWFDGQSEAWRGLYAPPDLHYGAWFGSAYDGDGLEASKVYYEIGGNDLAAVALHLRHLAAAAQQAAPNLVPLFTTLTCRRDRGAQRLTFLHRGPLRVADLRPLLDRLGMGHQLPSLMQVVGVALGGRFELPEQSVLIGLSGTARAPEFKLEVLLGMIPDLPPEFLRLLALSLAERPHELTSLRRWVSAFTPDQFGRPGEFSVLSVSVRRDLPARVSLYLRPIEFDLRRSLAGDGFSAEGPSGDGVTADATLAAF